MSEIKMETRNESLSKEKQKCLSWKLNAGRKGPWQCIQTVHNNLEHVTGCSDLQASTAMGADYSCADRGRITPGNEMPASTQQKVDEGP